MLSTPTISWAVAGFCLFATVYPYVLYPLVLRLLPARPLIPSTVRSDGGSEFALLFCAYNEATALPDKLRNLRELREVYPRLEILAYDDCSSDETSQLLKRSGLDIRLVRSEQRAGKAHGMKLLASLTDRDYLVFTDANVELALDALDHLRTAYTDSSVGGVCGQLQYVDAQGSAIARVGAIYWRIEELIKSLESRSGNVMGADGSVFSIRRNLYPEFPDSVLDDLTVSMAVIFSGKRLIKDPYVIAHERLVASRPDDVRRRIRIATRAFHTHIWLRPQLRTMSVGDRWRYWSHRYMRWHGAAFLIVGYASVLVTLAAAWHWALALGLVTATVLGTVIGTRYRLKALSGLVHSVTLILLTGFGVAKARRGETMTTWNPPAR